MKPSTLVRILALASLGQSYHSVLGHELAHVETDECGAPEFFSNGMKLLLIPGAEGRLDPAGIERLVTRRTDIHYPKPRVVTITQATEVGTVYTPAQVAAIGATARRHGLRLHMDGARFANAVASLGCRPCEITWQAGVDVLCFGGTKNGMHVAEAVVFFNRTGGRIRLPMQTSRAALFQNAIPRGAVDRHAGRRHLAAARRSRQRDGPTTPRATRID